MGFQVVIFFSSKLKHEIARKNGPHGAPGLPCLHLVAYGDLVREEADQIFRSYARDHRLSFCDALSFVAVTTLLHHAPCLTFDEDFRGLGLTVLP